MSERNVYYEFCNSSNHIYKQQNFKYLEPRNIGNIHRNVSILPTLNAVLPL